MKRTLFGVGVVLGLIGCAVWGVCAGDRLSEDGKVFEQRAAATAAAYEALGR